EKFPKLFLICEVLFAPGSRRKHVGLAGDHDQPKYHDALRKTCELSVFGHTVGDAPVTLNDSGGQKLGHFVGVNVWTDGVGVWNSARQCMPATKAKLG